MSKSLGNVLLVHDLLGEAPGEAIRLALLTAHYRQPLDWSDAALENAKATLDRLYGTLRQMADVDVSDADRVVPDAFAAALDDDLNTPKAFAELFALAKTANTAESDSEMRSAKGALLAAGEMLGLLQQDPQAWFTGDAGNVDADEVEGLIAARNNARAAKDFAEADRIRDQLADMGVVHRGPRRRHPVAHGGVTPSQRHDAADAGTPLVISGSVNTCG